MKKINLHYYLIVLFLFGIILNNSQSVYSQQDQTSGLVEEIPVEKTSILEIQQPAAKAFKTVMKVLKKEYDIDNKVKNEFIQASAAFITEIYEVTVIGSSTQASKYGVKAEIVKTWFEFISEQETKVYIQVNSSSFTMKANKKIEDSERTYRNQSKESELISSIQEPN